MCLEQRLVTEVRAMSVVVQPSAREMFTPHELSAAFKEFIERGPQYLEAEAGIRAAAYQSGERMLLLYEESDTGLVVLGGPYPLECVEGLFSEVQLHVGGARASVVDRNICHFIWYGEVAGDGLRSVGKEALPSSKSVCSILPLACHSRAGVTRTMTSHPARRSGA